jgi:hypothetical protein
MCVLFFFNKEKMRGREGGRGKRWK